MSDTHRYVPQWAKNEDGTLTEFGRKIYNAGVKFGMLGDFHRRSNKPGWKVFYEQKSKKICKREFAKGIRRLKKEELEELYQEYLEELEEAA